MAEDQFETVEVVTPRAVAWARSILSIEPRPDSPETLAPYIQAVMNAEANRVLLNVEKALVDQITP